jgi:hypothetical protein
LLPTARCSLANPFALPQPSAGCCAKIQDPLCNPWLSG